MKLYELINEHEFPKIKTHHRSGDSLPDLYNYDHEDAYWDDDDNPPSKGNVADHPDIENLGTGAFASAYRHKDTPQDITKGSKATSTPDGWQALFQAIADDKDAQANPYFPRFRSINKFKQHDDYADDAKESYVVKVEALEPYKNLSEKEREMLVDKIFDEHGSDVINHYWEETFRDRNNPRGRPQHFPGEKFAWAIRAALENDTWGDELRWTIQDEHFKEAIEFLQKTAAKEDYEFDLHAENLMIRRTSVGVQLVLNDPLGFSSEARRRENGDYDEVEGHPDWE